MRKQSNVFPLFFLPLEPKSIQRKQGARSSRSWVLRKQGEKDMRSALVSLALVFYAVIMLLFPSAWEIIPEAEARRLIDGA